jgi:hypothetical protein
MAEKANIIVEYTKEWFEKHYIGAAFWGAINMKNGFTMEPEFARFQNEDDAKKFKETVDIMRV